MIRLLQKAAATALVLSLITSQGFAQGTDPKEGTPAWTPVRRGEEALAAGQHEEATRHFLAALWYHPESPRLLARLAECAPDDDLRTLWSRRWVDATSDTAGKLRPDRKSPAAPPAAAKELAPLAEARHNALRALLRFAKKQKPSSRSPEQRLVVSWAARLGKALSADSPGMTQAVGGDFDDMREPGRFDPQPIIKALSKQMNSKLSSGDGEGAMLAALRLRGLAAQAAFKDLKGPKPPNLMAVGAAADRAIDRARALLGDQQGEPLTLDDLESMSDDERLVFTETHSTFANPGVAVSPNGLYRVETICGFETLLGVVETVELHHARLVDWYGQDPFDGRQGIVRIVPDSSDLEQQGTPYWWAGGFQSGDETTLKFSCSTIESLGHGITHELTHRFDGAIYSGLPAWLTEGRAVWTAGAYGVSSDPKFHPRVAKFGTMERTLSKGYWSQDKIEELVEGTIDDYRDNYVAGYSVFVYLATWEGGRGKLFAEPLQRFLRSVADRPGGGLEMFSAHFADGKDGRPSDMEAFAAGFRTYLEGFYWETPATWRDQLYVRGVPGPEYDPMVYDGPTWVWSRKRAEPHFGQDQAAACGDLLLEFGDERNAATAYVWALEVDDWNQARAEQLAALLEGLGKDTAAWVIREGNRIRFAPRSPATPAPFLNQIAPVEKLLAALGDAAQSARSAGSSLTAATLIAERNDIAEWLGVAREPVTLEATAVLPDAPLVGPARDLGLRGWTESGLTDYEEKRVNGLWYETEDGDLHVGRRRPRDGTGGLDARAHQRHAYVHTKEWFEPGIYRLTGRVHFTTSYVSGALVFGSTRRDRNLRVDFDAGDFMFSIGKKEEPAELKSMRFELHGLRVRDYPLRGATRKTNIKFENPSTSFAYEIFVDGGSATVFVAGQRLGTYHTVDGLPLEGTVGFAMRQGAVRVQQPSIQRLDSLETLGLPARFRRGYDLGDTAEQTYIGAKNRLSHGLPTAANGTLFLWIPPLFVEGEETFDGNGVSRLAERTAREAAELFDARVVEQGWSMLLPAGFAKDARESLARSLAEDYSRFDGVLVHAQTRPFAYDLEDQDSLERPWLMFVDSMGIVRVLQDFDPWVSSLSLDLELWSRVHQSPQVPVPQLLRDAEAQ